MAARLLRGFARFIGWLAIPPLLLALLALLMAADTALRLATPGACYDWAILLYVCSLALCLPQALLLRLFGVKSAVVYALTGAISMWLAMFSFACFLGYGVSNGYFVNKDTDPINIFQDYIWSNIPLVVKMARLLIDAPLHGFIVVIAPALFGLFLGRQYWGMRIAQNTTSVKQ